MVMMIQNLHAFLMHSMAFLRLSVQTVLVLAFVVPVWAGDIKNLGQKKLNEKDLIQIALLVPMTGEFAHVGQDFLDAAQIALFDVASTKIILKPYDTKGTKQGAKEATQNALDNEAQVILGPFLSGNIEPVKDVVGPTGIPILSFSNNTKALWSLGGGNTWVTGFLPRQQVRDMLVYAKKMGRENLAIFSPDNAYGRLIGELAVSIAGDMGLNVMATEFYAPNETDFSEQIKEFTHYSERYGQYQTTLSQLRQLYKKGDQTDESLQKRIEWLEKNPELPQPDFDMILVPALSEIVLRAIVAQMSFYEVDPKQIKILGLQSWDDFSGVITEPSLHGAWFVAPDRDERKRFSQRFETAYNRKPHRLASLAWDSMALVSVLGATQGAEGLTKDSLTNPYGFAGIDGIFRLRKSGLVERPEAVYEITPEGVQVIQNAPKQFFSD